MSPHYPRRGSLGGHRDPCVRVGGGLAHAARSVPRRNRLFFNVISPRPVSGWGALLTATRPPALSCADAGPRSCLKALIIKILTGALSAAWRWPLGRTCRHAPCNTHGQESSSLLRTCLVGVGQSSRTNLSFTIPGTRRGGDFPFYRRARIPAFFVNNVTVLPVMVETGGKRPFFRGRAGPARRGRISLADSIP
jgi:hypothetical protein